MIKNFYLVIFCFSTTIKAQDCKNYFFLQKNKIVEMTLYNKNGNENGKQVYLINDVKNSGAVTTSVVSCEMFDKNGKSLAKSSNEIQCNSGVILMDMKMFIPSQQMNEMKTAEATASKAYLEYPVSMKIGDKLKDGYFNMNFNDNGVATMIYLSMTERFIEAKERITSLAGSWDAFKISYKSKMKMKVAGIGIPVNAEVTEWYVPGFGTVKTESKYGSALITSIH